MNERERLLALLRERSLFRGEFTLASGKKSSYYFDGRLTTLHPEGAYLTAKVLLSLLEEKGIAIDAIGGPTLGADPMAAAVAVVSHLEERPVSAFIVRKARKDHGRSKRIEGKVEKGWKVAVVDDTMTTGGSVLDAVRALEAEGLEVKAVLCLVDREEGGEEIRSNYPFYAVFKASQLLEE